MYEKTIQLSCRYEVFDKEWDEILAFLQGGIKGFGYSNIVAEFAPAANNEEEQNLQTAHNTASTPLKCVRCGVNHVSGFCVECVNKMLKESNAP